MTDDREQIISKQKMKSKDYEIIHKVSKTIKDMEIEEIDFEGLEFEVLEMEKMWWKIKQPNFVFAQPTNWDNFSDEDDSESQDIENGSTSQGSQRKHTINKHKK